MAVNTSISWASSSLNCIRSMRKLDGAKGFFCVKYSPGCALCYASAMNARGLPGAGNGLEYVAKNEKLQEMYLDLATLFEPVQWRKPKDIFVASMTDWMMDGLPWNWAFDILAVANMLPRHRWLFLTKRAQNLGATIGGPDFHEKLAARIAVTVADGVPPPERYSLKNCWFGISVEDQKHLDGRMECVRPLVEQGRNVWLSAEPLLGALEFDFAGRHAGVKTVIVGGESGSKTRVRECKLRWIIDVVRQCQAAGVPVYVKQLGSKCLGFNGVPIPTVDSKGESPDEWPVQIRVRELIFGHVPERTLLQ